MNATDELTDDEWERVQADCRDALDIFRATYGDPDSKQEIVAETDEFLLLRDTTGHELNEIAEINDVDRSKLSRRMHEEARKRYHSDQPGDEWSVTDPVVILKA